MTVLGFRTRTVALDVVVLRGTDVLTAHARQLAALCDDHNVSASWPWLAASIGLGAAQQTPWAVALAHGEELVGAAVLIDDDSGSIRRTTLAGTAEQHRGAFLACDPAT